MVPKSFSAFQQLFEDSQLSGEVVEPAPPPEPVEPFSDPEKEHKEKILAYATDAILADLHDQEGLRDAVINSLPNITNGTVLLVISPTLDDVESLIDFISNHPRIKKFALGARKLQNGERVRAIKLSVVQTDDECEPPDEATSAAKEDEQETYKTDSNEEDPNSLRTGFFRGAASIT